MRHVPQTFCTVVERPPPTILLASTTTTSTASLPTGRITTIATLPKSFRALPTNTYRMDARETPTKRQPAPIPPRKNSTRLQSRDISNPFLIDNDDSPICASSGPPLVHVPRVARIIRVFEFESASGVPMSFQIGDLIEVLSECNTNWCMAIKYNPKTAKRNTFNRNDQFFIPISNIEYCDTNPFQSINGKIGAPPSVIRLEKTPDNRKVESQMPSNECVDNGEEEYVEIVDHRPNKDMDDREDYERRSDEAIGSSRDSLIEDDNHPLTIGSATIPRNPRASHNPLEPIYSLPLDGIVIDHSNINIVPKAKPRRLKESPDYANIPSHPQTALSRAIQKMQEGAVHVRSMHDGWGEFRTKSDGRAFYWNSISGETMTAPPPGRRLSTKSYDDSAMAGSTATFPMSNNRSIRSRQASSFKKYPMPTVSDNNRLFATATTGTTTSANVPLSLATSPAELSMSSDSSINDKNTSIALPSTNPATTSTSTTPMTTSLYRSEQLSAQQVAPTLPPVPPPLPSPTSTFSSSTLPPKRFNQTSNPNISLFNGHAGNVAPSGSNTIGGHRQISHSASHNQASKFDFEHTQQSHPSHFKKNTFLGQPAYQTSGQYPQISGPYQANNGEARKTIMEPNSSSSILSKTRSFKTQSMLYNRPTADGGGNGSGSGIQRLESFKKSNLVESFQNASLPLQPPTKVSKADAIHHGLIWIYQHIANKQTEKPKKGKKSKNGIETYGVLTKDYLLFFKNEKSAFDGGKNIEFFALLHAKICWEMSNKPHRFEVSTPNHTFLLHHTKEQEAREWYDKIESVLNSQSENNFKLTMVSGSPVVYKQQISHGSAGTSTPPSDRKIFNIREKLKQLLRFRPTVDTLKEKGIFREELIFNRSLDELCSRDGNSVPRFVRECVEAIEKKDMKAEGLYRACGNLSSVQKLRFDINLEKYQSLYAEDDVHVLTGLLKMFFRTMAEPLFPSNTFVPLIGTIDLQCSDLEKIHTFKKILATFPTNNYETICFILDHLLRVIQYSRDNRMNIQNLAIVFGPTLLRPKEDSKNLFVDMSFQINQCRIVEFLLKHFDSIFGSVTH